MAIFPLFSRKSQPQPTGNATPTFFPLDWVSQYLSNSLSANDEKYLKYYLSVPELQSVINYKSDLFASMRVKEQKISNGEFVEKSKWLDLINNPNVLQNFDEFATQANTLKSIFGNGFINKLKGVTETYALFNLPAGDAQVVPVSENMIIFNQTKLDKIIKEYKFKYNSGSITYKPSEIIHFNDTQVRFDLTTKDYLKGLSKIQALTQACENIRTAYSARGILQGNAPVGMISNKSKDGTGSTVLDPTEKKAVQDNLKKYGLAHDKKYQFIVTGMELAYVSMATNIGNLKLYEEIDADLRTICNQFKIPPEIFLSNVTYENKKEAKKQVYQDVIIPEAENWLSMLSKGLGMVDTVFVPDYSHIAILQTDLESRARMHNWEVTALSKAFADGVLTNEQYILQLEKIGMI